MRWRAARAIQRRQTNERAGDRGDVDRYEQLRGQALSGAGGSQLGLALLQHRGVSAWAQAWHTTAPAPVPAVSIAQAPLGLAAGEQEIVRVLASIALACAAAP